MLRGHREYYLFNRTYTFMYHCNWKMINSGRFEFFDVVSNCCDSFPQIQDGTRKVGLAGVTKHRDELLILSEQYVLAGHNQTTFS